MNTSNIKNYKPKDFAEVLGVSVKTLQRWIGKKFEKPTAPMDRRYYTYDQYFQFKGIYTEDDERQIVLYSRVSTRNQKTVCKTRQYFCANAVTKKEYWFEKFRMKFHTTIIVVNNESLSPQEELVQDIISIIHAFSCRLYRLRKYKK